MGSGAAGVAAEGAARTGDVPDLFFDLRPISTSTFQVVALWQNRDPNPWALPARPAVPETGVLDENGA